MADETAHVAAPLHPAATGFTVNRDGSNFQISIPSARDQRLIAALSFTFLFAICVALGELFVSASWNDDFVCCLSILAPLVLLLIPVPMYRAISQLIAPGARAASKIGLTDGVFWIEPADEPKRPRWEWPVDDVLRLKLEPGRWWTRRRMMVHVWTRTRGPVHLSIHAASSLAIEPLQFMLQHALQSAAPPAIPVGELAKNPDQKTLDYLGAADANWTCIGSYSTFREWLAARDCLLPLQIPMRLSDVRDSARQTYELLVPAGDAATARAWLVRPATLSATACRRCGGNGKPLPLKTRLTEAIVHPRSPIMLSPSWRRCERCGTDYRWVN